ncbi:MAG: hypothetical protein ABJZ55_07095 [Fuerstiella sp.]
MKTFETSRQDGKWGSHWNWQSIGDIEKAGGGTRVPNHSALLRHPNQINCRIPSRSSQTPSGKIAWNHMLGFKRRGREFFANDGMY